MSFIAAATAVGTAVGLSGTAALIGGGVLLGAGVGAGVGGLYSGITGDGDVGQSMLYGGLGGAALGGGYAALAPAATVTGGTVAGGAAVPVNSTAVALGGSGGGGAFVPAAGSGASFAVPGTTAAAMGPTAAELGYTASTQPSAITAADAASKAAITKGGLTGTDILLGTAGLGYLMNQDNKKYGTPSNAPYDGPLTDFKYSRDKYTPLVATPPSPAYQPQYANYRANPYTAAKGGVVAMAGGGIAMANPSVGPVEQMSRDNATGNNMMFPQANINTPSFASATNRPMSQDIIGSAADTAVDPYTGTERFAEGGIAATPQAQATPDQITRGSMNFNNEMMSRLQGVVNSPAIQQTLSQNPLQQAQPYAAPMFTRPTPAAIPFANPATIVGTKPYNDKIAAEAEAARQADLAAQIQAMSANTNFVGGGSVRNSNMQAVDDYMAQYKSDPATVSSKAKSGDYNAMVAMNRIKNTPNQNYAAGGGVGHLGGYASGGNPRLLKGPGDGMSDNIPATIGGRQPARLADGEFVVPADVVSHLGNGSTDAGAKHLYNMMDKVRKARTGNKKQGKQIKPEKYLKG